MISLRRPPSCHQIVELITDYLEGTLSSGRRRRFETHLGTCAGCARYVAQMRLSVEMTGQYQAPPIDPGTLAELQELFRAAHDSPPE